jgi:hypothetical protein
MEIEAISGGLCAVKTGNRCVVLTGEALKCYNPGASWGGQCCGVEQWQLVGLITRRSQVRILAPLPWINCRPSGLQFSFGFAIFSSGNPNPKEDFHEP